MSVILVLSALRNEDHRWLFPLPLLASGALIHPDLTNPVTAIKLGCVLVLMFNGLSIAPAMHRLLVLPAATRFGHLARALLLRLMTALSVSQACWWTAVLIGLINSTQ